MKKMFIALSLFVFSATSSYAIDCYLGCTKVRCKGQRDVWNDCFDQCWRNNESKISNCKAGASESDNISREQAWIMGYFNGQSKEFPQR